MSKHSVKWYMIVLAVVMTFFSACQPTPEEEIVTNKGDAVAEKKVFATAEPGVDKTVQEMLGEVPLRWEEDMSSSLFIFEAKADIVVNDSLTAPVYDITYEILTGDVIRRVWDAMKLEIVDINTEGGRRSKEEIQTGMKLAAEGTEKRNPDGTIEYVPWPQQQTALEQLSEWLKKAKSEAEMYIPATDIPDFEDQKRIDTYSGQSCGFHTSEGDRGFLSTYTTPNKASIERGIVLELEDGILQPEHWWLTELWTGEDEAEVMVVLQPKITEEEAMETALAYVKRLGEEELEPAYIEKARYFSDMSMRTVSEGYVITFVRTGTYVPFAFVQGTYGGVLYEDESTYAPTYTQEKLQIYVTEKGIRNVTWTNPMSITGCLNENVELMPFEEILKKARTLIHVTTARVETESGGYCEGARITRVVLSAVPQKLKDDKGYALMPVWIFEMERPKVSQETRTMEEGNTNKWNHVYALLINAVDGTCMKAPL